MKNFIAGIQRRDSGKDIEFKKKLESPRPQKDSPTIPILESNSVKDSSLSEKTSVSSENTTVLVTSVSLTGKNSDNNPIKELKALLQKDTSKVLISQFIQAFFYRKKLKNYYKKSPELKKQRLRWETLKEIQKTEETLHQQLTLTMKLFYVPLKEKNIIPADKLDLIFGMVETIKNTSEEMCKDLKVEFDKYPVAPNVGFIFKKYAPFLKVYNQYIINYDSASAEVEKLELKNKKFAQFLAQVYEKPECETQRLLSFLVKPVQRIPRYSLLFRDLLDRTPEDHVDYQFITQALTAMTELATFCNERKRKDEFSNAMIDLQELLDKNSNSPKFSNIIKTTRKLLFKGTVQLVKEPILQFDDVIAYIQTPPSGGLSINSCILNKSSATAGIISASNNSQSMTATVPIVNNNSNASASDSTANPSTILATSALTNPTPPIPVILTSSSGSGTSSNTGMTNNNNTISSLNSSGRPNGVLSNINRKTSTINKGPETLAAYIFNDIILFTPPAGSSLGTANNKEVFTSKCEILYLKFVFPVELESTNRFQFIAFSGNLFFCYECHCESEKDKNQFLTNINEEQKQQRNSQQLIDYLLLLINRCKMKDQLVNSSKKQLKSSQELFHLTRKNFWDVDRKLRELTAELAALMEDLNHYSKEKELVIKKGVEVFDLLSQSYKNVEELEKNLTKADPIFWNSLNHNLEAFNDVFEDLPWCLGPEEKQKLLIPEDMNLHDDVISGSSANRTLLVELVRDKKMDQFPKHLRLSEKKKTDLVNVFVVNTADQGHSTNNTIVPNTGDGGTIVEQKTMLSDDDMRKAITNDLTSVTNSELLKVIYTLVCGKGNNNTKQTPRQSSLVVAGNDSQSSPPTTISLNNQTQLSKVVVDEDISLSQAGKSTEYSMTDAVTAENVVIMDQDK